ncbi:hypothetical protein [Vibrio owensii]|uniref:hypothetical protein n=1 Tax=Vibrio owensii TaxID=696485 RepID=UPI003DA07E9F
MHTDNEPPMKNLAGNEAMLFLFRFECRESGISFVLNEGIAEDMYIDISARLQPLVHACCETLLRYRSRCQGNIIMDGHILLDGDCELMLFPGLGQVIQEAKKRALFDDARTIAQQLLTIMERREQEYEKGAAPAAAFPLSKLPASIPHTGLEALGQQKRRRAASPEPGATPTLLSPDDLPKGVQATMSYDHRGYCLGFSHRTLGYLGKLVAHEVDGETVLAAELFNDDMTCLESKQTVMEAILTTITARFEVKGTLSQEDFQ